jgi:hypothetical protein
VARRRASRQQVQIIGANKVSDYIGPVGVMGVNDWRITMRDGHRHRLRGELRFTGSGTALIASCDCSPPRLLLGARHGHWGSIVVDDAA